MTYQEHEDFINRQVYKERKALHQWVGKGHDPERNPWGYLDEDSWPMNYVEAYRRHKGYYFVIYYHITEE